MAKQTINIGTNEDDGTGDGLRDAFDKVNDNFTELFIATGGGNLSGIDLESSTIKTTGTNADLILDPNGTGKTQIVGDLEVTGSITGAVQLTIVDDSSTASVVGTEDTLAVRGGTGISTSVSGDTLTITNDSPNVDQNVFTAFNSDSGSKTASSTNDSLSVLGGGIASTSISGNVLTVTATETDTLQSVLARNHVATTRPHFDGGVQVEFITIRDNNIETNASNADLYLNPNGTGAVRVASDLSVVGTITGDVTGDLTGNADTATALATARSFTLAGAVTSSSASFDGTGDVTLNAIANTSQVVTPNAVQTLTNKTFSDTTAIASLRIRQNNIESLNSSANIGLNPNGTGKVEIFTDRVRVTETYTPVSSVGVSGDQPGDVAFDENYIYYCTGVYDGSTVIWKRAAITAW